MNNSKFTMYIYHKIGVSARLFVYLSIFNKNVIFNNQFFINPT